jgi:hypothetical protein
VIAVALAPLRRPLFSKAFQLVPVLLFAHEWAAQLKVNPHSVAGYRRHFSWS